MCTSASCCLVHGDILSVQPFLCYDPTSSHLWDLTPSATCLASVLSAAQPQLVRCPQPKNTPSTLYSLWLLPYCFSPWTIFLKELSLPFLSLETGLSDCLIFGAVGHLLIFRDTTFIIFPFMSLLFLYPLLD